MQVEYREKRNAVIIGAGRIGRGFLGDIFNQAGYPLTFVDSNLPLITNLLKSRQYHVYKSCKGQTQSIAIGGYRALHTSQVADICMALSKPKVLVAVSVPSKSLPDVAATLALAIAMRAMDMPDEPMDVLMCVNAINPAQQMRSLLEALLGGAALEYMRGKVGFVDTVVMCTSPNPTRQILQQDSLGVLNNGYPVMWADAKAFVGEKPSCRCIIQCENMYAQEIKKMYTANMAHATLAYIGAAKGYVYAIDAIYDPQVKEAVCGALEESTFGLIREFGLDPGEMRSWNQDILDLLDNPLLGDSLSRLGADTARKLGVSDRLVGPALLCLKAGKRPAHLLNAIAAGYLFTLSEDPGTRKTQDLVSRMGIVSAIEMISGFDIKHPLQNALLEAYYTAKDSIQEATR